MTPFTRIARTKIDALMKAFSTAASVVKPAAEGLRVAAVPAHTAARTPPAKAAAGSATSATRHRASRKESTLLVSFFATPPAALSSDFLASLGFLTCRGFRSHGLSNSR